MNEIPHRIYTIMNIIGLVLLVINCPNHLPPVINHHHTTFGDAGTKPTATNKVLALLVVRLATERAHLLHGIMQVTERTANLANVPATLIESDVIVHNYSSPMKALRLLRARKLSAGSASP